MEQNKSAALFLKLLTAYTEQKFVTLFFQNYFSNILQSMASIAVKQRIPAVWTAVISSYLHVIRNTCLFSSLKQLKQGKYWGEMHINVHSY